jgi:signal transduction histidine kinase
VKCSISGLSHRLAPAVELNLFRIVQETLQNLERHARAKTVRLRLALQNGTILLRIQDDGRGFDPGASKGIVGKGQGIGLTNMRERAVAMGGIFEIVSGPKKGTTIVLRVPCAEAKEADS